MPLLLLLAGCGLSEMLWPTPVIEDGMDGDSVVWTQPYTVAAAQVPSYQETLPEAPLGLSADALRALRGRLCSGVDGPLVAEVLSQLQTSPEGPYEKVILNECVPQPDLCDALFAHLDELPAAPESATLWHAVSGCSDPRRLPRFASQSATDVAVLDWFARREQHMQPVFDQRALDVALNNLDLVGLHGQRALLVAGAFANDDAAAALKNAMDQAADDRKAGFAQALFRQTDDDSRARLQRQCDVNAEHYSCVEGLASLDNIDTVLRTVDVDLSLVRGRFSAYESTVDQALRDCVAASAVGEIELLRGLLCASTLVGADQSLHEVYDEPLWVPVEAWQPVLAVWSEVGPDGIEASLVERGLLDAEAGAQDSATPPVTVAGWMIQRQRGYAGAYQAPPESVVRMLAAQIPALQHLWVTGRSAQWLEATRDTRWPRPEVFVWRDGQRLRVLMHGEHDDGARAVGFVNALLVDAEAIERVVLTHRGDAIWGPEPALRKLVDDGWVVPLTRVSPEDTGSPE